MNYLKNLLKMLATIAVWFMLSALMVFPVKWLNTQNYAAHDTPDPKFTVIVLNEQGDPIRANWQQAQHANWVRHAPATCETEDCLRQMPDGSLKFHNEGAFWFSVSHYRIVGDRIEPISFVLHTLGDVFVQMILATVLYQIGKYGWTRWRLRGSPDELKMYHQMIVFNLKLLVLAIVVFVAIIWAVESR